MLHLERPMCHCLQSNFVTQNMVYEPTLANFFSVISLVQVGPPLSNSHRLFLVCLHEGTITQKLFYLDESYLPLFNVDPLVNCLQFY